MLVCQDSFIKKIKLLIDYISIQPISLPCFRLQVKTEYCLLQHIQAMVQGFNNKCREHIKNLQTIESIWETILEENGISNISACANKIEAAYNCLLYTSRCV